jgi:hypothetical protein
LATSNWSHRNRNCKQVGTTLKKCQSHLCAIPKEIKGQSQPGLVVILWEVQGVYFMVGFNLQKSATGSISINLCKSDYQGSSNMV